MNGAGWSGTKQPWGQDDLSYVILRLKTGETLLAKMNGSLQNILVDPMITVIDPVLITFLVAQQGWQTNVDPTAFTMKPLLSLSVDEDFMLASDVIMAAGNMKYSTRIQYDKYVAEHNQKREAEEREESLMDFLESIGVVLVVDID